MGIADLRLVDEFSYKLTRYEQNLQYGQSYDQNVEYVPFVPAVGVSYTLKPGNTWFCKGSNLVL